MGCSSGPAAQNEGPAASETTALGHLMQVLVQVGQAVTFVGGAFSEYTTVAAAGCWPVQEASPEVACLAVSGLTAIGALEVCLLLLLLNLFSFSFLFLFLLSFSFLSFFSTCCT